MDVFGVPVIIDFSSLAEEEMQQVDADYTAMCRNGYGDSQECVELGLAMEEAGYMPVCNDNDSYTFIAY
jgi:hypothetical protein